MLIEINIKEMYNIKIINALIIVFIFFGLTIISGCKTKTAAEQPAKLLKSVYVPATEEEIKNLMATEAAKKS